VAEGLASNNCSCFRSNLTPREVPRLRQRQRHILIASVLDPRIKTKWLKTLPDGEKIIDRIREFLKKAYSTTKQPVSIAPSTNWMSFEYRFLEAFQPTQYYVAESDIDKYFDTPTVSTGCDISRSQSEFIRNWWKANMLEYSCMAKVAQDHLAIPAAEVDIERLFNGGRDVLGIRRFSMKGKTLGGSSFIAM
jgi:hypothetical protein